MKVRSVFVVGLLVIAVVGWLAVAGAGPTPAADGPRPGAPASGRYQLVMDKHGEPGLLFDTTSGEVWKRREIADGKGRGEWIENTDPPKK